MKINNHNPLLLVLCFSGSLYLAHKLLFVLCHLDHKTIAFRYSVNTLFTVFTLSSALIIIILNLIKTRYFDSIGYAFMALTSLKIGLLLFWAHPILKSTAVGAKFEKGNFFILFALFLAIETVAAIRILNNKQ